MAVKKLDFKKPSKAKAFLDKVADKFKNSKKLEKLGRLFNIPVENSFTGVVLTPFSIRILDLEKKNGDIFLNVYIDEPSDSKDPFNPNRAKDINKIIKDHNLWTRTVSNLAGFRGLFVRQLEMPEMQKEEAVESLRFTERENVPFPLDEASIDAWILGEGDSAGQVKVLMGAMEGKEIAKYNNLFAHTRLRHLAIVTVPSVLVAIVENSKIMSKTKPVPIISIGKTVTGIYVYQDGYIKFSRDIKVGGGHITDTLATEYTVDGNTFELSENEAEELKDFFGIPEGVDFEKTNPKGITGKMVREKLQPVLDKIVNELGRSIDYYTNQHKVNDMPSVYLIGAMARFNGLPEYLSNALGNNFTAYNAFDDFITIEKEEYKEVHKMGPDLTLTIGLALDQGKHLNLLPKKLRYSFKKVLKKAAPFAAIVAYILAVVIIYASGVQYAKLLNSQIINLSSKINTLKGELMATSAIEGQIVKLKNKMNLILARKSIFPQLRGSDIAWQEIFSEIGSLMPPEVALYDIEISFDNQQEYATDGKPYTKQIQLNGAVRGEPSDQINSLRDFLLNLQASPTLAHASLITSKEQPGGDDAEGSLLAFSIAADINKPKKSATPKASKPKR